MNDTTKNRIKELVPEITELKDGCYIKMSYGAEVDTDTIKVFHSPWKNREGEEYVTATHGIDAITVYLKQYHLSDNYITEILGRPITISDILRAIRKKNLGTDEDYYAITSDGLFIKTCEMIEERILWNLSKDYDQQEEEVKAFIGKILGV